MAPMPFLEKKNITIVGKKHRSTKHDALTRPFARLSLKSPHSETLPHSVTPILRQPLLPADFSGQQARLRRRHQANEGPPHVCDLRLRVLLQFSSTACPHLPSGGALARRLLRFRLTAAPPLSCTAANPLSPLATRLSSLL